MRLLPLLFLRSQKSAKRRRRKVVDVIAAAVVVVVEKSGNFSTLFWSWNASLNKKEFLLLFFLPFSLTFFSFLHFFCARLFAFGIKRQEGGIWEIGKNGKKSSPLTYIFQLLLSRKKVIFLETWGRRKTLWWPLLSGLWDFYQRGKKRVAFMLPFAVAQLFPFVVLSRPQNELPSQAQAQSV